MKPILASLLLTIICFTVIGQSFKKNEFISQISNENNSLKNWVNSNDKVKKYFDFSENKPIKIVSKTGATTILNINEYDWEMFFSPQNEPIKRNFEDIDFDFDETLNGKIFWSMRKNK